MKPVLAVIVATALVYGPSARPVEARPAEGSVRSLSVIPASGKAEIVIGVSGGIEVRDFTLSSPNRIVLDFTGASLGLGSRGYDRVARGGIKDVRYSQFRKGTVRVVVYLDGPHAYQLTRSEGEVHVTVATSAGTEFSAWHSGGGNATDERVVTLPDTRAAGEPAAKAPGVSDAPMRTNVQRDPMTVQQVAQQAQQRSQQPRISVVYQGADIRDVLAAFASFAGRTIIPSSSVGATKVDAEIRDQPWDVALQAILSAQGLDAREDANGIIIVDTQERIASRVATEQLVTRVYRVNYQRATAVGDQIRQRLLQCIPSERYSPTQSSSAAAGQPPAAGA
ncbi:MAG: AMIN domain-containing protein, partial [Polaromonas sp.]|nr:AMIN domain-containing protein [Gemmatimonadaceae bacterium]